MNLLTRVPCAARNTSVRLPALFLSRGLAALITLMCLTATPALAVTYSDNGDGTVTDPTTGLTWMRCSMGQTWSGSTCTGTVNTYTWDQAVALTGTVSFAGNSDWRLPNFRELQTIVDKSHSSPAIDPIAFPSTPFSLPFLSYFAAYWSSTPAANVQGNAWYVDFNNGNYVIGSSAPGGPKSIPGAVRLVRAPQSTGLLDVARPTTDYVDHGDGTATYIPSGLMWMTKCVANPKFPNTCAANNTTSQGAVSNPFAGYSDWRVPTLYELLSLTDYTTGGLNATVFTSVGGSGGTNFLERTNDALAEGGYWAGAATLGTPYPWRLVRGSGVQSFDVFALTVISTGTGAVNSTLTGINCGSTCTANYITGTKVILAATPPGGVTWGGACSGTAATCTVTMSAAKNVTAAFHDVPVVSTSPTSIDFANQNLGSSSATQSITLTNTGTAALTITGIVASGDYAVTNNCGTGLGAGGFCTLNITFTPTATGTRTGAITITDDAFGSPQTISVSGVGQGGVASPDVTSKTFASQGVGTTSVAQTITLTNTGGAVLTIVSISASGDFAQTNNCGTSLAAGANCTISVTFTPTAVGTRTGSLTFGSPNAISLSGTGVAVPMVSLNPTTLTFGPQNVGTSSTAQTFAMTNSGGTALTLSGIVASGDFSQTNNCGGGLVAGGSCTISVTFMPTVTGARNGAVTITSNAPGSPHAITLSGGVQVTTTTTTSASTTTTTTVASTTTTTLASTVRPMISTGGTRTCALTTAGGVKCWGYNGVGGLGDGTTIDRYTPVDVSGLTSGVVAIDVGGSITCALTTAGGVKCWGYNLNGGLGDTTTTNRYTPVDVSGLTSGVAAVAAADNHACAMTTVGGVKCWGYNEYGRLGDNTTTERHMPVDVSGLTSGIAGIATGNLHTCALTTAGGVKCWGYNGLGGLGDGTTIDRYTPVDVSGLTSGVAAISAGHSHTCALTTAGSIKCWGDNVYGQLGDNTTIDRTTPVDVSGLTSGVVAISAGDSHTCAMTMAGGVKCWGYNFFGGLGDNTTINRTTPVDVSGLTSGVVAISAGAVHTCALTTAGDVECWGRNAWGQLGDGTNTQRLSPVMAAALNLGVATLVTLNLSQGWNLLGNGVDRMLSVASLFGDPIAVTTVWKWDTTNSGWQFYAPSMDATQLQTYTASKGYEVLSMINPGEGFWVNSKQDFPKPLPYGTPVPAISFQEGKPGALKQGWNLISIGNSRTPSGFNGDMSALPPTTISQNITTLWAWDNALGRWYFYAPTLEAQGGTVLTDYIATKGYLDFTANNKLLGPGVGFWVNKP